MRVQKQVYTAGRRALWVLSLRLGLRGLALGLTLVVALHALAAHDAPHGEGQVTSPISQRSNKGQRGLKGHLTE